MTARVLVVGAFLLMIAYTLVNALRVAGAGTQHNPAAIANNLLELITPLAGAIILMLVLVRQTRKTSEILHAQVETERRFRLAVEAARFGIWEWRLDDDVVEMSDVVGVMLGWGGGGSVRGEDVIARIAPEHQMRVRQALADAAGEGAFDVSFRVPRVGGGSAWIDARGQDSRRTGQGFTSVLGVALDVTEERGAEARAQQAEQRLQYAIESASEAFVLWDRAGRLVMCNEAYRTFFALEPRLVKPGAAYKQVRSIAALAIKGREAKAGNRPEVVEAEMNDGRWLQISERRTADGGLVMTATDITALKRQEAALLKNEDTLQRMVRHSEETAQEMADLADRYQAETVRAEAANRSKSEFLANMSHELRTPLNAINGFSEMMAEEMFGALGDKRYKGYAQDILASGKHLLALINDILDMSKIEAGKMTLRPEVLNVQEVLEDAARLMRSPASSAGLTMSVRLSPDLPVIEADHRAVKQVLLNLLSNAVKFTPRGGRVAIEADRLIDEGETAGVRIAVVDTGIGIAAKDMDRLAKPFEQIESQHAKTQQGTGLGLALTKSLVELHGGRLEITSKPGRGTNVAFTLPIRGGRRRVADPAAEAA